MNEELIIEAGQKIRVAGQTYKAGEDTSLPATLEPVKMQTNRHLAMECKDPDCLKVQRECLNGRVLTIRSTSGPFTKIAKHLNRGAEEIMPGCPVCNERMVWRESTDQPETE